jgi:hypothetical protein
MNDQLQAQLVSILANIQTATGRVSDFAVGQLPDTVQQYLIYGRISSLAFSLMTGGVLAVSIFVALRHGYFGTQKDLFGEWPASRLACLMGGSTVSIFSGYTFAVSIQTTLLVWLAPKVWLLQSFASLLK